MFYGWYIVAAGAASNFLLLGVLIFSFGVFIKPMRDELGWSVTAISAGVSLGSFQSGGLSPFTGQMADRLGPRRTGLAGVAIATGGLILLSQVHHLWTYYLAFVVISFGQSLGAYTPFTLALIQWFRRQRGKAMGFLNTGNALGYFAVPIVTALVVSFGWRHALLIAAAAMFALGLPLALVLRDRPERYGLTPDGDAPLSQNETQASATSPTGMSLAEALRTPAFYLTAVPVGLGGATFTAWAIFLVPHLQDGGFSKASIAWIVGIYGVLQATLRVAAGWMGDVVGRKRMFAIGCLLWGIGLVLFANLNADRWWMLPLLYLTASVGHASWSVMGQTIVADYFGTRRFATLRGMSQMVQLPLGVVTPIIMGSLSDMQGDYVLAYEVIAAMMASGAICLALVRRPMWDAAGVTLSPAPAR